MVVNMGTHYFAIKVKTTIRVLASCIVNPKRACAIPPVIALKELVLVSKKQTWRVRIQNKGGKLNIPESFIFSSFWGRICLLIVHDSMHPKTTEEIRHATANKKPTQKPIGKFPVAEYSCGSKKSLRPLPKPSAADCTARLNDRNSMFQNVKHSMVTAWYAHVLCVDTVSYTHLTLPTNREV
eukprot:TRINITY_DN2634_c0_g1_i7.p1 TRINITY_DN2634_c0_g1~~TRINITY_DN2634_c0_g1_i7.p1  ORF type:complete len:182 (+),score=31.48 TRINITY_DN2634_c0_g1_i7:215-760(+)